MTSTNNPQNATTIEAARKFSRASIRQSISSVIRRDTLLGQVLDKFGDWRDEATFAKLDTNDGAAGTTKRLGSTSGPLEGVCTVGDDDLRAAALHDGIATAPARDFPSVNVAARDEDPGTSSNDYAEGEMDLHSDTVGEEGSGLAGNINPTNRRRAFFWSRDGDNVGRGRSPSPKSVSPTRRNSHKQGIRTIRMLNSTDSPFTGKQIRSTSSERRAHRGRQSAISDLNAHDRAISPSDTRFSHPSTRRPQHPPSFVSELSGSVSPTIAAMKGNGPHDDFILPPSALDTPAIAPEILDNGAIGRTRNISETTLDLPSSWGETLVRVDHHITPEPSLTGDVATAKVQEQPKSAIPPVGNTKRDNGSEDFEATGEDRTPADCHGTRPKAEKRHLLQGRKRGKVSRNSCSSPRLVESLSPSQNQRRKSNRPQSGKALSWKQAKRRVGKVDSRASPPSITVGKPLKAGNPVQSYFAQRTKQRQNRAVQLEAARWQQRQIDMREAASKQKGKCRVVLPSDFDDVVCVENQLDYEYEHNDLMMSGAVQDRDVSYYCLNTYVIRPSGECDWVPNEDVPEALMNGCRSADSEDIISYIASYARSPPSSPRRSIDSTGTRGSWESLPVAGIEPAPDCGGAIVDTQEIVPILRPSRPITPSSFSNICLPALKPLPLSPRQMSRHAHHLSLMRASRDRNAAVPETSPRESCPSSVVYVSPLGVLCKHSDITRHLEQFGASIEPETTSDENLARGSDDGSSYQGNTYDHYFSGFSSVVDEPRERDFALEPLRSNPREETLTQPTQADMWPRTRGEAQEIPGLNRSGRPHPRRSNYPPALYTVTPPSRSERWTSYSAHPTSRFASGTGRSRYNISGPYIPLPSNASSACLSMSTYSSTYALPDLDTHAIPTQGPPLPPTHAPLPDPPAAPLLPTRDVEPKRGRAGAAFQRIKRTAATAVGSVAKHFGQGFAAAGAASALVADGGGGAAGVWSSGSGGRQRREGNGVEAEADAGFVYARAQAGV